MNDAPGTGPPQADTPQADTPGAGTSREDAPRTGVAAPRPPRPVPPERRGATRIAERVVAKLAAQAAREALRRMPERTATPWVPSGRHGGPTATVSVRRQPGADGTGGLAHVRVTVELGYPSDLAVQCRAIRHHVARRVGELAGMDVPDVAVDIERLHTGRPGSGDRRRRVR